MAPPKRKAKAWPRKERIMRPRYAHRERRKRPVIQRRVQSHEPINVRQLVYSLLNADEYNQERKENIACNGDSFPGKMRKYRKVREPSYDSSVVRDNSVSMDESEYTKSAATSIDDLSGVMDAANSLAVSSSENSSLSNVSVEPIVHARKSIDNTRALLKKKSLVQVINNYIRAGIEEGKRQAKKYIRKALSFGVKSGYLIPTDPQGQLIRVSPALIESKRGDAEARKRRRKARKGEDDGFICDSEYRRPTPPWNRSQKPYREPTPKPETPPKKRRKISVSNELVASRTTRSPKKKIMTRGRRGRSKKKTTGKNGKTRISNLSVSLNRSDEDQRRTRRKRSSQKRDTAKRTEENKTRRGKSPRTRREEKENSRKNRRISNDEGNGKFSGDEKEDERTSIGRRKSTTSREDPSRNNDIPDGHPVRERESILEDQNNEDVQNSNVDNMN